MQTISKFIVLTGIFFAMACNQSNHKGMVKVKLFRLTDSTIYDMDLVSDFVFDAEELNVDSLKDLSRQLFLKGIDEYKNKKSLYAAVKSFKASILIFPDAKTYYELGNALLDMKTEQSLKECVNAFDIAERIQFQPRVNLYYKKACAYNLRNTYYKYDDVYAVFSELNAAIYNGFTDTTLLKNDWRLKGITSMPQYQELIINMKLKQVNNDQNALFALFKSAFPTQTDKLIIGKENVDMNSYKESISYDFAKFIPEMENTSFGRDVSHDYFYVAKVKETDLYTALVYSSVSFEGEAMQPVNTTLAVYNNQTGEVISRKPIACQCSAERIRSSIVSNGQVEIEDYNRIWEKPITEVSFDENKVKEYQSLAKAVFSIGDDGIIIAKEVSKGFSDSLNMVAVK